MRENLIKAALAAFLLAVFLPACGGQPAEPSAPPEKEPAQSQPAGPAASNPAGSGIQMPSASVQPAAPGQEPPEKDLEGAAKDAEVPSDPAPQTEADPRRAAFAELLRTAHDKQILPDGSILDGFDIEGIEKNLFALHDVDGDGREELILLWSNACMAGMTEIVYDYDEASGQVREELSEFPGVIFYDNGMAEAGWSHNQGLAGRIWPYNLYQYQPEDDRYEYVGSVDAWDRSLGEINYMENGASFPEALDADGDGLIYYLLPPDWEGQYDRAARVDGPEYQQWLDSFLADAGFQKLSFVELTGKNIAEVLGVPYVELVKTLMPNAAG